MNNLKRSLLWAWRSERLPTVAMAFSILLLTDAAIADNYKIVPGHSIGKVWIGAGRGAVHKILGKPVETYQRNDETIEDVWLLPNSSAKADRADSYKVLYAKNRVVQIETTAPTFSTWGLSLRSDPLQIRRRFGRMRVSIYDSSADRQELTRYLYDNARRGIAFTVVVQSWKEVATRFQSVIVHRRGCPVVPNAGDMFMHRLWDDVEKNP